MFFASTVEILFCLGGRSFLRKRWLVSLEE